MSLRRGNQNLLCKTLVGVGQGHSLVFLSWSLDRFFIGDKK